MTIKVLVDEEAMRGWVEVAHVSRTLQHCLRHAGGPRAGSPFAQVSELYPFEKVSDRARAYLTAAVEHLIFWADLQAPLKFHPEQSEGRCVVMGSSGVRVTVVPCPFAAGPPSAEGFSGFS